MSALLGDRIRKEREKYGMSQAELARRIKVSKQTMYEIENNKTLDPGVLKVLAIAQILRVSVDALVGLKDVAGLTDDPTPPKKRPRRPRATPVSY